MKKSELKQLIKEILLTEEYTELFSNKFKSSVKEIVNEYLEWEQASFDNYPESENSKDDEGWNTKDAKIEILNIILDGLNSKSKRKDKIQIK